MQVRIEQQSEQVSDEAPLRQSSDRELLAAFVSALLKQGETWQLQPRVWKPQGFFKDGQLPRRVVRLKADNARLWLSSLLHAGPVPAREVLEFAKLEGFNEWALRRAKKYHGIQAVRVGGAAWRGKWEWRLPVTS